MKILSCHCAAGCFRFELSWPPSSVVPEPKKGELKPRWVCWFIPHTWELKPLWVLPHTGKLKPLWVLPHTGELKPLWVLPHTAEFKPLWVLPHTAELKPLWVLPHTAELKPLWVLPHKGELKPRWHLRYIRELQKRVIWCVSGDCTLASPCPFAASVFPDHISVLVMCHALCSQITSVSQSCVVPCVPRLHQCPSHVSCLVFPGYNSVLNMCHAMCAQSVPDMCHALCSQITAVSKSCVMPYVPRSQQCPSHVFYVPRSSTSVEVWLHLAWQKRLSELPWRGEIVVTCNGKEKVGILSFSLPVSLLLPPPPSAQ